MKIYTIVNAVTGKVNMPFVCENEAEAKEFCIKSVLSDPSGSLLGISKFLYCHELGSFDVSEENFEHYELSSGSFFVDKKSTIEFSSCKLAAESFIVYDLLEPFINQLDIKKEGDVNV